MSLESISQYLDALKRRGLEEDIQRTLDDLVHEISDNDAANNCPFDEQAQPREYEQYYAERSLSASNINNQGETAQLTFIANAGCLPELSAALTELLN